MTNPHTQSVDLSPPIPDDLTPEQGIAMWLDLMDACEQFLLAGLRREIGPDGDLQAAHRKWYEDQMQEHDEKLFRMVARLDRIEAERHGR